MLALPITEVITSSSKIILEGEGMPKLFEEEKVKNIYQLLFFYILDSKFSQQNIIIDTNSKRMLFILVNFVQKHIPNSIHILHLHRYSISNN